MEIQVDDFLSRLSIKNGYSRSTRQAYGNDLRRFIEFLLAELGRPPQLSDFNPGNVAEYLQAGWRMGLSANTLLRRRASLRRFAEFLRQQGEIEGDPTEAAIVVHDESNGKQANGNVACLTSEEVARMRKAIQAAEHPRAYRDLALYQLLLETALSIGTLVDLNLDSFNADEGRLVVKPTSGSEVAYELGEATAALKRYLREGRPDLGASPEERALFISQMGGRMSRQGVWHALRNWGKQAGLSKEISPRLLRNTAAMRMIAAGQPLESLQHLLGHRNPLSTRALVRRLKKACAD